MKQTKEYYSIPEAAKICGVSRGAMWSWVKTRRVTAFVTPGGHHRIAQKTIDQLLSTTVEDNCSGDTCRTIIVVDKDQCLLKNIAGCRELQSCRIITAVTGFEAGVLISSHKPEIVILNVFLEGIDAFGICRTIKDDPVLERTKILALSEIDTPEIQDRILREGADAFIPKHAEFNCIFERIERMLVPA